MADVQSNIEVNLDASQALAQLKSLQAQLAQFNNAIATSNKAAARAQANLTSNLINSVNATGKFAASITTIKSSTDAFTDSLERNKFSTREYFRYAGGATKSFGRLFKTEFNTIGKVAEERVKTMQTQYIKMGRDANGAIKAIAVRPLTLDMNNLATKTALAAQKQQLLNQLLKQGSTNLLNFGKNTQWAGRQLMVGFTIPLSMLAVSSSKTFMALEKQAIRFKRVYGEMFTTTAETSRALKEVELLAKQFTKYGVAVEKTMQIAADAAATGKMGADLMAQVAQATRLAVLGGVEQEQALETTISLTNAFGIEADKLRGKIDFLNAVENQTVLNIEDLTIAIPKAAPVIRQLGGDVEDLAFFMTAMKEGGINASEGANALKSGLASLINPSKKASAFLADFGVNIKGIVESNKGDIKSTVVQFAQALDTLDPLNRARAIEQLFGKFQFSRLSTLFQNITKDGTQASRTLNLASNSIEELAILSERELAKVENATGTKFKKTMEDLKVTLAPIGEQFLKAVTPIVEFIGKILEKFNGLSDGVKAGIVRFIGIVGLIGPAMLMTFGLIANGAANIIKLFITLRKGFMNLGGQSKLLGEQTQYMTSAQIEATTVAASLDQAHSRLRQSFLLETEAANQLTVAYQRGVVAANNFARVNPGMMRPGFTPKKFNKGGLVPGSGNTDTVPAMLTPGEFVVNKQAAQENRGLLPALNKGGFALRGVGTGKFKNIQNPWAGEVKGTPRYDPTLPKFRVGSIEYAKAAVAAAAAKAAPKPAPRFIGMPTSAKKATESRQTLNRISDNVKAGKYGDVPPTDFGTLHAPFTGFSFPARGVGGVYRKPNGQLVVVKPTIDENTAIAEVRYTEIVRAAHRMVSPKQSIKTMMDPTDPTGQRKFIVIESPYDPRIAAMDGTFSEKDMVKQVVASTLRGDKDLQKANVSGNIVADGGTLGVYDRASGFREFAEKMPSMEEQAIINLGGVKGGGAKQFFAKETSSLAAKMTPAQYDAAIKKEIRETIPRLEKLIKSWDLDPTETIVYQNMIDRLKAGENVDWSKFQPIHSAATFNKGGFVERMFGTPSITQGMLINPATSVAEGQMRLVAMHLTDDNKGRVFEDDLDIPRYHPEQMIEKIDKNGTTTYSGGKSGQRKTAGYTLQGPEGYNQFTKDMANYGIQGLPEPYPLTADDMINAKDTLTAQIQADKLEHDQISRTPFLQRTAQQNKILKNLQKRQRACVIALNEIIGDARSIGIKSNRIPASAADRSLYSRAMADRYALAASTAEGERLNARRAPGSVYNRTYQDFLDETNTPGATTTSIRRGITARADAHWTPGATGEKPLLTDKSASNHAPAMRVKLDRNGRPLIDPSTNKPILESIPGAGKKLKAGLTLWTFNGKILTDDEYEAEKTRQKSLKDQIKVTTNLSLKKSIENELQQREKALKDTSGWSAITDQEIKQIEQDLKAARDPATKRALGERLNALKGLPRQRTKQGVSYFVKNKTIGLYEMFGMLLQSKTGVKTRVRTRSLGTPGYGEPETVPALLTPGEFIASPALAQQIGPALQYINNGGKIEQRSNGTIVPGTGNKDTVPMMLSQGSFVVNKGSTEENKGFLRRFHKGGTVTTDSGLIVPDHINPHPPVYNDPDGPEQTPSRRKAAIDRIKASQGYQFATKPVPGMSNPRISSGLMATGMGAGMLGMAPGKTGEISQKVGMLAIVASLIAPLLKTKVGLVVVALGLLAGGYMYLKKRNEALITKTMEATEAMGASAKSLNEIAVFANKVTGTEIMNRKRQNSFDLFQIQPGKTSYGESFVQSESGQKMLNSVSASRKENGSAVAQSALASQLATSVAGGILTSAQARSIASELGKQLNDYSFGINVNAKLNELVGITGKDLLKDPIEVRTKLNNISKKEIEDTFKTEMTPLGPKKLLTKNAGFTVAKEKIALESSRELLDSYDVQTEKQIKELENKGKLSEAKTLAETREEGRKSLVRQIQDINKKVETDFNSLIDIKDAKDSLIAANAAAKNAYKGTIDEKNIDPALKSVQNATKDQGKIKAITLQLAAKNLDPNETKELLSLFTGDAEGTKKVLEVLVTSPVQATEASGVLGMFVGKDKEPLKEIQKQLFIKMTSTDNSPEENQKNIEFFKTLGKSGGVVDMKVITTYLLKNPKNLEGLQKIYNQIQKHKGKLKIDMITKMEGVTSEEIEALNKDLAYYNSLPPDQQKTYTFTFLSSFRSANDSVVPLVDYLADVEGMGLKQIDAVISNPKEKAKAKGRMAAFDANQVTEEMKAAAALAKSMEKKEQQKGRDSLLDDMLKKLKLFHESTIKATGGFNELMKVMTAKGKIPINFDGTINKLRTLGEGKVSEDYLRFVESLTPEQLQDKELMNQMGIKTKYDKKTKKTKITGIDKEKQQKFEAGLVSAEVGQNYNNTVSALVEMERRTKAINTLRLEGFSEQEANNVVSTDGIALAITQGKISKEDLDTIKQKQKELTRANFINERFTKTAQMDAAESQSKQLQMAKAYIDLQEKMIENEYIKEKTKLNIQKGDNDYALEQISRKEYDINESYDKQITALEEINSLREKENELTSRKMSIAEAFASGDMSAAASAMQEYRNAKIAQNARNRMEALQKAKENAIKGVTATGQDGKVYTKEDLEKMNRAIDQRFIDMENEVRVKKIELDKLTQQTTKLTKDQIDAAISTINLAVEALGPEGAAKFLDNVFEVLDGSTDKTKESVIELHKEFKDFVKTMDEARIKAAGFASGDVIPNSVARANAEATAALNAQIAASDGEQKIANQKESQGFGPRKSAEEISEQLRKDAEYLDKRLKEQIAADQADKTRKQEDARKAFLGSMRIPGYRSGGKINGPGTSTSDSIPALLSDGEYVVNAASVDKYGVSLFESLNAQKLADGGYLGVPGLKPDGKFKRTSIAQKVVGAAGTATGAVGTATGAVGNFLKEVLQTTATSFIRPVAQGLAPSVEGLVNGIAGIGGAKPNFKFGDVNVAGANLYKKEGYGAKDLRSDILGIGLTVAPYGKILKPLLKVPGVAKTISTIAKPVKAVGSKIAEPFKKIVNLPKTRKEETARKTAELFDNTKNKPSDSDIWPDMGIWEDIPSFYTPPAPKSRMQTIASTIAKPLTLPAKLMSNAFNSISHSWKYGENPYSRWNGSFDYLSLNPLIDELSSKSIGKLAQKFNPKLTVKNNTFPEEFSMLQKYMQNNLENRSVSNLSYKNIPKNIIDTIKKKSTAKMDNIFNKTDWLGIDNPLYNYLYSSTPLGNLIARKTIKTKPAGLTDFQGNKIKFEKTQKVDGPGLNLPIKQLLENPFYHGGNPPNKLVDRFLPASDSKSGNWFESDFFATSSLPEAYGYAVTKNVDSGTGDMAEVYKMFFGLNSSKTWDMRPGFSSLYSQNKKAYRILEKRLADKMGIKEARKYLLGERIPGTAYSPGILTGRGTEGPAAFTGFDLGDIFTEIKHGIPRRIIDNTIHKGGIHTPEKPSHTVVSTMTPSKVVEDFLKLFSKETIAEQRLAPIADRSSILEKMLDEAIKSGKAGPITRRKKPPIPKKVSDRLRKLFEPKNTVYAATKGMKLPPVAKKTQNKTAGSNYYLSQGADDDISLYHSILSAGPKGEKGSIKGLADLLHDPFDGSTLQSLGNKGSMMESFDLMALALMDAARMSGTTKTGLNTSINSGRTDYSQKLVDKLRARGLDKIVDIQPRIKPSFVDESGKKTPPGSKVGGQVWLENELRFLNKENSLFDILKSSTPIPNNVVNIARQSLLDLLKYGFDKKRVDDAVKQYGKGMNIPGYAMGGMVPKYMAAGGFAQGTDTVPAMLTPGEFVVNRKATQKFGPLLSAINSPTFETPSSSTPKYSNANVSNNAISTNNSKTLYNYNLSVNVSNSNANPNDIARTVINQIRQIDNQRIRGL